MGQREPALCGCQGVQAVIHYDCSRNGKGNTGWQKYYGVMAVTVAQGHVNLRAQGKPTL